MCYLNNTVGNIHKIFNVIVQFAPSFIDNEKPESQNTVKLHHGINLNCKVDGNPEPAIIWLSVSITLDSFQAKITNETLFFVEWN